MRITVSVDFHVDTIIGTTIVLFQTIALAHWRHEICPRNHRKQSDTIHVWQNLLEIELHNFYIFYFRVAKVRKINRTKKCGWSFRNIQRQNTKKSPFYFVFSLICTTFATKFKKMVSFSNITLLNLLGLRLTGTKARKVCSCYQA